MIESSVFHKSIEPGIYLKLLETQEAKELFYAINNNRQYLLTWLPWVDSTRSVLDSEAFIADSLRKYARKENLITGIWHHSTLIGCIGFNEIVWLQKKATIGYWLSANYQGKGIITKSCRLLIDYAFDDLCLQKIEILCATENHKSRAVPQRLLFKQESILTNYLRLFNEYVDFVVYSIDKDTWQSITD